MPKKTIITKITVGQHDPDFDIAEARDPNGTVLQPASRGVIHRKPGESVTLDAAEADAIVARWGGEVLAEIPDEAPAADPKAAAKAVAPAATK